jgi:6-phosphogluconolactonase
MLEGSIQSWDSRRDLIVPGEADQTIAFAAEHWIHTASRAILERGRFAVALSGGSTPKAIYQALVASYKSALDWKKVLLFWSDERAAPPTHPDSNYRMAMESGLLGLPIPPAQIFRMKAEEADIEKNAIDYEEILRRELGPSLFDLVMLGVGEDGHTASLFPKTGALSEQTKLVAANHLPEKNTWRMTLTFPCIRQSQKAVIYAIGENKQAIAALALRAPIASPFPSSAIGTSEHKSLWVLDRAAARLI